MEKDLTVSNVSKAGTVSQSSEQIIEKPHKFEIGFAMTNYNRGMNNHSGQFRSLEPTGFIKFDLRPYLDKGNSFSRRRPVGIKSQIEIHGNKSAVGTDVNIGVEGLISNPKDENFKAYAGLDIGGAIEYHPQKSDWFLDNTNADRRYNYCPQTLDMPPHNLVADGYIGASFRQKFGFGLELSEAIGFNGRFYSKGESLELQNIPYNETPRENFERRAEEEGIFSGKPLNPLSGYANIKVNYTVPKTGLNIFGQVRLDSSQLLYKDGNHTQPSINDTQVNVGISYNFFEHLPDKSKGLK